MALIFLFVDGVGIGHEDDNNPFYTQRFKGFEHLAGGKLTESLPEFVSSSRLYKPIDANLGVEGLPQSGTGQASLFCGMNMAERAGKHFGPYPHSTSRDDVKHNSIFTDCLKLQKKPHFINAYPQPFFEFLEKKKRYTCTTLMTIGAGLPLQTQQDIENAQAITAEIKQDYWRQKLGLSIPEITETDAAQRLIEKTNEYDLVLFEYYLTDKAGHTKDINQAVEAIVRLDNLLFELVKLIDTSTIKHTLVLTSDHGNVENLSVKTHTKNPVPLFVYGANADCFSQVNSILDVRKAVYSYLEKN